MPHASLRLLLGALSAFALASSANADAPSVHSGKPPEIRTILPPSQSPPLSAAQRAKLASALTAPYQPPIGSVEGVKAPPLFTALPPAPDAPARSPVKPAGPLSHPQLWSVSPALGNIPRASWSISAEIKPPRELVTTLPPDPVLEAQRAEAMARKLTMTSKAGGGALRAKPNSTETRGPASPAQASSSKPAPTARPDAGRPR